MARYIDAELLTSAIEGVMYHIQCNPQNKEKFKAYENVLYGIEKMQKVEIVRCKDCKYHQDNNGGYPNSECRWGHNETPDADDFCSYGEMDEI